MTRSRTAAALLVAAILATGCSRAIEGTPVATPGQAGITEGAALLDTTCGDYLTMDKADRLKVMTAIGEAGNRLVAIAPEAWVDLSAGLCTFVDPGVAVKEVVRGAAR